MSAIPEGWCHKHGGVVEDFKKIESCLNITSLYGLLIYLLISHMSRGTIYIHISFITGDLFTVI